MKRQDFLSIAILLVILGPIYILFLYFVPFQVNTDEISHMYVERLLSHSTNPFSMSGYFYMPAGLFITLAKLSDTLGGVTLYNMRLINAVVGILIIIFYFALLRIFLKTTESLLTSLIFGFSHSLIGFSRTAAIHSGALLIELASLGLLLTGLRVRSYKLIFLGGLMSGLSFYNYFPARLLIVLWLIFLAVLYFRGKHTTLQFVTKMAAFALVGCAITAVLPIVYSFKDLGSSTNYAKAQILMFDEARKLQQSWVSAPTIMDGMRINLVNGLTAFNNKIADLGYIYYNPGHGFVDPLSGLLIWVGLIIIFQKKHKTDLDILVITCFLFLWLFNTFFITKNPNYGRLLMILPFSSYLIFQAIANFAERFPKKRILFLGLIPIIIGWNLLIFGDFIDSGIKSGDDVGGTGRLIEQRINKANYSYYLAADKKYPYFRWGNEEQWVSWLGFFAPKQVIVFNSTKVLKDNLKPPFVLFLSKSLWQVKRPSFQSTFPSYVTYNIKPDGSLLAIEVK